MVKPSRYQSGVKETVAEIKEADQGRTVSRTVKKLVRAQESWIQETHLSWSAGAAHGGHSPG
jgi:hypothetical protein